MKATKAQYLLASKIVGPYVEIRMMGRKEAPIFIIEYRPLVGMWQGQPEYLADGGDLEATCRRARIKAEEKGLVAKKN